uniref:Uncharacterized protein n=1 Tax=Sphaerodactylus townsendi TaxID=933632 RepID=A0ACB8FZK5_9SAUR
MKSCGRGAIARIKPERGGRRRGIGRAGWGGGEFEPRGRRCAGRCGPAAASAGARRLARLATMGEDGAAPLEAGGSSSPVPSGSRSPSLHPAPGGSPAEAGAPVNAITVLTLLDKLVHMLESVQEKQQRMEGRQLELEAAVKGVQGDLGKLCKSHASTANTVAKLLEKSRKVSAHTRDVRERLDRQCAQVKRLEHNHAQLLRRNHFKVLIFQSPLLFSTVRSLQRHLALRHWLDPALFGFGKDATIQPSSETFPLQLIGLSPVYFAPN